MGSTENRARRGGGLLRLIGRLMRTRRGNIAAMTALALVPLTGLLGMATEASSWFLIHRAAQNAADSAVLTAATNGGNGGADYATEARSVTASYGFTDGANGATITVPAPAPYAGVTPCATSPCYRVSIAKTMPVYLLRIVGYNGTSGGIQNITASALATTKPVQVPFCLLAVGTGTGNNAAISSNGSPNANLQCNVMSNGDASCSGHTITTGISDAAGTNPSNKLCANRINNGVPPVSDPYATLASSIPPDACGGAFYPETDSNWPSANNTLSGNITMPAQTVYCGDVKLGSDVQVTSAAPGSLIVIENGQLDLNGYTLQSLAGSGVTIVFTSPQNGAEAYTSGGTPTNFICNNAPCKSDYAGAGPNGVLDIAAPTSGTWSGMAIFQNPSLPLQGSAQCTGNDQWGYSGNKPTWDITGIVDIARTRFCVSGAINKSTNGYACLIVVTNTMTVNGTGDLFYQNAQSQCPQAGVTQITNKGYVVGQLVY